MFITITTEKINWLFGRQRQSLCPVCGNNNISKTVSMQSDTIRLVQINTCHECEKLPADTIISRAVGVEI
jgi:hypothetical protein